MLRFSLVFLAASTLVAAGCASENSEDLTGTPPPAPACPATATAPVSYATSVGPLLLQHCRGCHRGAAPAGNVSLETHAQVQEHAKSGRLVGSISHAPGFSPMPRGGAKLSDCDVATIRQWVDAGALNN